MSSSPKVLDADVSLSKQYVENLQAFDPSFIKDAKFGSESAKIFSTVSYFPEGLRFFFSFLTGPLTPWALFMAPANFFSNTSTIFSYQILPVFGTMEALLEKKKRLQKKQFRKTQAKEQKEKLLAFFTILEELEEDHTFIQNHIGQYHKG